MYFACCYELHALCLKNCVTERLVLHLSGVPLPLIGMVAYGFVSALSLQLTSKNLPLGINRSNAQLVLLGSTTSMAAASAYFMYILTTSFSGSSCTYCLLSVLLSFSLFFITLKVCNVKSLFFLLFTLNNVIILYCCLIGTLSLYF